MTAPDWIDDLAVCFASVEACRECGCIATLRADFPTGRSEFFCAPCVQNHEAISDTIDQHELAHFNGAYGLVPRPVYKPISAEHGLPPPERFAELIRLARIGMEAEAGWRPIETAPRGGTRGLVCRAAEDAIGNVTEYAVASGVRFTDGSRFFVSHVARPTHWRPLPTHPKTGGENE